ncbi:hypothetical protein DWZ16_10940 [Clostridium sp. AF29-8BH]|jgi:hypothetical protein|uniref:hypothetical protein n=1 Tax=Clostridium sp. AF29-8BH TaxID=2293009 RepID=UPI000E5087E4|nr:hypothetical protein DWZ16_10940 [Clostridium sp. AF29-8BH]
MGKIWIPGGGGYVDIDSVTATAGDVEKGKVFVNSNGDPVTGTLELTGNAAANQVLSGKTFYNTQLREKQTGTLPERSVTQNGTLGNGSDYIAINQLPEGFYRSNVQARVPLSTLANYCGLTPYTIKEGVTIAGVTGKYKGATLKLQEVTGSFSTEKINFYNGYLGFSKDRAWHLYGQNYPWNSLELLGSSYKYLGIKGGVGSSSTGLKGLFRLSDPIDVTAYTKLNVELSTSGYKGSSSSTKRDWGDAVKFGFGATGMSTDAFVASISRASNSDLATSVVDVSGLSGNYSLFAHVYIPAQGSSGGAYLTVHTEDISLTI